jgi:hypothetical protein
MMVYGLVCECIFVVLAMWINALVREFLLLFTD